MSVYPFVEAEKVAERNVASACALMEVSRSAFYGWHHHEAGPRALADAKLETKIVEIHRASRATYGAPRITAALAHEGTGVGRKRVARLMARCGLAGRARPRKIRTTIPDPGASPTMIDRLRRAFAPDSVALDHVYLCDITDIRTHARLELADVARERRSSHGKSRYDILWFLC
jgi:putative transposase